MAKLKVVHKWVELGRVHSFMLILGRVGLGHFTVGRVGLGWVKKIGPTSNSWYEFPVSTQGDWCDPMQRRRLLYWTLPSLSNGKGSQPAGDCKASLTLARIFFPQCRAIWRAKSCHFSGTKSVKTARWRIVCAMSCHLSRISYELSTKCVTANFTHVHLTMLSWQVVTPCKIFRTFHYFTWPTSSRIPTHTVTSSSLIGTPNCMPWRRRAVGIAVRRVVRNPCT